MGPGDTIALVAIVGGLIATTILIGTIFKRIMSYKEKQLALTADRTAEKAAQYATSNKELEDRVRVLERIVTDRGYDVATQIEALRDQRRVEERLDGSPVEEKI